MDFLLMAQLLQKLSQRENAAIFNHPVMASEYPDYHQIVLHPMDLGTIQGKLKRGDYPTLEACAKDVRLVWTNAYLYNPAESVVAESAHHLSKVFEGMYNKINPNDFNYDREPNVEERQKLSRDIYRVDSSQLAEALKLLEARCPRAVIRNKEEGYVVVKIEALPSPVFWEVEIFLRRRLSNRPDLTKKKISTTLKPMPDSLARSKRPEGEDGGSEGSEKANTNDRKRKSADNGTTDNPDAVCGSVKRREGNGGSRNGFSSINGVGSNRNTLSGRSVGITAGATGDGGGGHQRMRLPSSSRISVANDTSISRNKGTMNGSRNAGGSSGIGSGGISSGVRYRNSVDTVNTDAKRIAREDSSKLKRNRSIETTGWHRARQERHPGDGRSRGGSDTRANNGASGSASNTATADRHGRRPGDCRKRPAGSSTSGDVVGRGHIVGWTRGPQLDRVYRDGSRQRIHPN